MLAQEEGRVKGGETGPLLTHFSPSRRAHLRESHLCSSNRPYRWDNHSINTGNEKKVGHAAFHGPKHSHVLTGHGMKSHTWHPFLSNTKVQACRVKLFSYFIREQSQSRAAARPTPDVLSYVLKEMARVQTHGWFISRGTRWWTS